jgi:hypothetical protein
MEVRLLIPGDAKRYWTLRLEAVNYPPLKPKRVLKWGLVKALVV